MNHAAFITGCNRGLGKSLLQKYAENGYDIIACTRNENSDFSEFCRHTEAVSGIKIYHIYMDLSCPEKIPDLINQVEQFDVDIDVLINNAGINPIKPLFYTDYPDLLQSFSVNYFSPVLITKHIAGIMIRQGHGSIVNITSIGSLGHQPGGCCYDASKAALNQLTITTAQELAPFGIRVNSVACGPIKTDMFGMMPEKAQKKLLGATALKRAASCEEIANMVFLLTSDSASYVTGQIFRVDGGAII